MTPQERGKRDLREAGYAAGGAIKKDGGAVHSDEAEDKKLIKEELGHARIKAKGGGAVKGMAPPFSPGRKSRAAGGGLDDTQALAKGGKVKGKPGIGKVNIVIAHGGPPGSGAAGAGGPPPMPPKPPMPPPGPPMGGPPPGGPPPGMPPGAGGPPPGLPPGGPGGPIPPGVRGPMPPPGMPPGGPPMRPPMAAGGAMRDAMGRFVGGAI